MRPRLAVSPLLTTVLQSRSMPHPTLQLDLQVPSGSETAVDVSSPRPQTRSCGKSPAGKWSSSGALLNDSLPPGRYSPYKKAESPRKRAVANPVTGLQPPRAATAAARPPRPETAGRQRAASGSGLLACSIPLSSPTAAVASKLEGLSMTWPVSARTRARAPRHLPPLDAADTFSADLLNMVPGAPPPDVPRHVADLSDVQRERSSCRSRHSSRARERVQSCALLWRARAQHRALAAWRRDELPALT